MNIFIIETMVLRFVYSRFNFEIGVRNCETMGKSKTLLKMKPVLEIMSTYSTNGVEEF
jgi:hypothetical protein